jgi:quercetin dioxygenase-like cupin family protein
LLTDRSSVTPVNMMPGISRRTLNYGDRTLLVELTLDSGSVIPAHSHPHEQIGYLVKGKLVFEMEGLVKEVSPGDSWVVPSAVEHKVTAMEDSIAIDVFSPVREDYK